MPAPDILIRIAEMREFYPADEHGILDEAIETILNLREQVRNVSYSAQIRAAISELNEDALFIDGMDDALIGHATQWGSPALAVYDSERIIEILSKDMGIEEAAEFYAHNIECAYVGKGTPLLLGRPEPQ